MRNASQLNPGARRVSPARPKPSAGWHAQLRESLRGSVWFLRLPLWLYLAYVGVQEYLDPAGYNSIFFALNLCIHEGGHLLCRAFPETIHVAAGTAAQLIAPVVAMVILGRQRDFFGMTFCLGWLSTNLTSVGVYMADARARELPLVTAEGAGSSDAITTHDWAYLFGQAGLMQDDTMIGFLTRAAGSAMMILALLSGAWIMVEMALANRGVAANSSL
jgi:hypothetical protein